MNSSTAVNSLSPESGLLLILAVETMSALHGCPTDACQTGVASDLQGLALKNLLQGMSHMFIERTTG